MSMVSIKVAFVALTVAVLAVSCRPGGEPDPEPGVKVQSTCDLAMSVPPYSVTYEDGSVVGVPSGPVQFRDITADGEVTESQACSIIVKQWVDDRRAPSYRVG